MSNRAFTLIEVLVVISIIAILSAVLFPVFTIAKSKANAITCLSNLKQIGIAVKAYCNDHQDRLPVIDTVFEMNKVRSSRKKKYDPWADPKKLKPGDVLAGYIVDQKILVCPSAVNGLPYGAGKGNWKQTYVFYGRDFSETCGFPDSLVHLNQFDGRIQQTGFIPHAKTDNVTQPTWVRDSKYRMDDPSADYTIFPHAKGAVNELRADGHAKPIRLMDLRADF